MRQPPHVYRNEPTQFPQGHTGRRAQGRTNHKQGNCRPPVLFPRVPLLVPSPRPVIRECFSFVRLTSLQS